MWCTRSPSQSRNSKRKEKGSGSTAPRSGQNERPRCDDDLTLHHVSHKASHGRWQRAGQGSRPQLQWTRSCPAVWRPSSPDPLLRPWRRRFHRRCTRQEAAKACAGARQGRWYGRPLPRDYDSLVLLCPYHPVRAPSRRSSPPFMRCSPAQFSLCLEISRSL